MGITGAENRIRTDDLLITNELLYQLSYFGISQPFYILKSMTFGKRRIGRLGCYQEFNSDNF